MKIDGRHVKIYFQDIKYAESYRNYSKIINESKQYLVLLTRKRLDEFLPSSLFKSIHKSYFVSIEKIVEFDKGKVKLKNCKFN